MAQIDTLTNVGAVVSTDLALILRGGANVLGTLGSMVGQNATAVTITGGTINGTTIGATTPATVAATTLTTTGAATFGGNATVNGGNAVIGTGGGGNGLGALISKGAVANFYEAYDGTKTMIAGTDAGNDFVKIGSLSAHPVGFVVGNVDKMRIDASGNLLAGTSVTKGSRVHSSGASASASPTLGSATDTSLLLSNSDVTYGMNFGVINNGNGWIQQHSNTGTAVAYDLLLQPVGGNVGIGVVPEAWSAGFTALEVGGFSLLSTNSNFSSSYIQSNAYYDGAWKYKTTGLASQFVQTSGFSTWGRAVSGTADAALTWIEDMRLDASGNFLVGKSTATDTTTGLWVAADGRLLVTSNDQYAAQFRRNGSDGTVVFFYNDAINVGSISVSGAATAYNTSSDPRLKSAFVKAGGALAKIVEAHDNDYIGVFNFLTDPDVPVLGYNAHALIDNQPGFGGTEGAGPRDMAIGEEYEPAVIDEDGNEITPAKKVTPAGVDQSKRVPLLEAAIYDLLKMNEALTARIEALEGAN